MTGGFALSDPVLPSQLPRQTGGRRGERLLAVAMPDQCRLDLRALEAGAPCNGLIASSARPPPRARGRGSAATTGPNPYAFVNICEILDLDPARVRDALRRPR
jgi:hypothetical protein